MGKNAPLEGKQGLLDGKPERNTQISRMAFVLNKVCVLLEEKYFLKLSTGPSWSKPGGKFLDKNNTHMTNAHSLKKGWWLDGCASLDKKIETMYDLRKIGMSYTFINCTCDFISGKSIKSYLPSEKEQDGIIKKILCEEDSILTNGLKAWCDVTQKVEIYELTI